MVSATRSKRKGTAEPTRETASASSCPTRSGKKRARVALACQRCKFRKQKCDGGQPNCTNCENVGCQCEYIIPTKSYPYGKTEYTRALEDRIAYLEARVPEECLEQLGNDHYEKQPSTTTLGFRLEGGVLRRSTQVSTATQTEERYFEITSSGSTSILDGSASVEPKLEPSTLSASPTPTPTPPLLPTSHRTLSLPISNLNGGSANCNEPLTARSSRGSFDGWIWEDNVPPQPLQGLYPGSGSSYSGGTGGGPGDSGYYYMGSGMDPMSMSNGGTQSSGLSFEYQDNSVPFWGGRWD